jgi:hypothetical protein
VVPKAELAYRGAGPGSRSGSMAKQRWSQRVTERSNALDLDPGVFTRADLAALPARLSARRSAVAGERRRQAGQAQASARAAPSVSAIERRSVRAGTLWARCLRDHNFYFFLKAPSRPDFLLGHPRDPLTRPLLQPPPCCASRGGGRGGPPLRRASGCSGSISRARWPPR